MSQISSDEVPNLRLDINFEFSAETRGYEISFLGVSNERGYIKSNDLKEIKIQEILSLALRALPLDQLEPLGRKTPEVYTKMVKTPDKEAFLHEVGLRAAVARLTSMGENKEVMECFGVSQATATRWISAAQEAGYLD